MNQQQRGQQTRKPDLDNYVDVATRLALFHQAFPDGSLQQKACEFREHNGEVVGIYYLAAAYRSPDDPRPGHGAAWEPFPGRTPYTRGSEVQNAETSAWGRAIVALGIGASGAPIATREDVTRSRERQNAPAADEHDPWAVTPDSVRNDLAAWMESAGLDLSEGVQRWAEQHDGEHIKNSTDVEDLTGFLKAWQAEYALQHDEEAAS